MRCAWAHNFSYHVWTASDEQEKHIYVKAGALSRRESNTWQVFSSVFLPFHRWNAHRSSNKRLYGMLEKSSHKSPTGMENFLYLFATLVVQHRQIRRARIVVTSSVIWYSSRATSYSRRHTVNSPTLMKAMRDYISSSSSDIRSAFFSRVCCLKINFVICVVWWWDIKLRCFDDFSLLLLLCVLWTQPHPGGVRWEG